MADDGDLVAGRYRLREKAGRGQVWRARDEQLDRDVAVKQLVPGQASLREARAAAKLSHPHAVTVYDVLEHQGKPFLVMELLPTCLAEVLVERGPLPRGMVADVGRQIAAALTVAHGDGILHRDVSPATVLLTHDGTAKIADFGVSRGLGTPAYLAPEVAGGAAATARSDVYSLGATLYTALEGHPPVGAAEDDTEEVVPPARTGPLADFLLRMLRRDPDRRPAMAEAADVLAKVAAGVRKPVRPAPVARRRTGKRRVVLVAAAVGVLAGGTAIALTVTGAANRPVAAAPGTGRRRAGRLLGDGAGDAVLVRRLQDARHRAERRTRGDHRLGRDLATRRRSPGGRPLGRQDRAFGRLGDGGQRDLERHGGRRRRDHVRLGRPHRRSRPRPRVPHLLGTLNSDA